MNFINLNVPNEALFYESLRNFLDALICYVELNTNIDTVDLTIQSNFINYIGGNLRSYNKITVDPYEINYWE